jgi:hypothetical protein
VSGWDQGLCSGAIPWISSLSVCLSVCLSSQASCVTVLHPVSSAPVLTGHRQSWSPLTASPPSFCVTALGPQHCHQGLPPACLPTLWPLEPDTGLWLLKTVRPSQPPTHRPGVDAVVPTLQPSPRPCPRGGHLESVRRGPGRPGVVWPVRAAEGAGGMASGLQACGGGRRQCI